jgi:hypothetical protein
MHRQSVSKWHAAGSGEADPSHLQRLEPALEDLPRVRQAVALSAEARVLGPHGRLSPRHGACHRALKDAGGMPELPQVDVQLRVHDPQRRHLASAFASILFFYLLIHPLDQKTLQLGSCGRQLEVLAPQTTSFSASVAGERHGHTICMRTYIRGQNQGACVLHGARRRRGAASRCHGEQQSHPRESRRFLPGPRIEKPPGTSSVIKPCEEKN